MENLSLKTSEFLLPFFDKMIAKSIMISFLVYFAIFISTMFGETDNKYILFILQYGSYMILGLFITLIIIRYIIALINKVYDISKNDPSGSIMIIKYKEPIYLEEVIILETYRKRVKTTSNNFVTKYCYLVEFSDGEQLEFTNGTSLLKVGDKVSRGKLGVMEVIFKFDDNKYFQKEKTVEFNATSDVANNILSIKGKRISYKEFKSTVKSRLIDLIH